MVGQEDYKRAKPVNVQPGKLLHVTRCGAIAVGAAGGKALFHSLAYPYTLGAQI